jgi:DNA-binding beta-propeller fold protein YncE
VVDLQQGKRLHSITGLGNPQGTAYVAQTSQLYVTNEKDGRCGIYDGKLFALRREVDFKDDADNVRYDNAAQRVYVGYGEGGIGVIDAQNERTIDRFKLTRHPEAFVLEKRGRRIFVSVPDAHEVAVIDPAKAKVVATWKTDGASANFPMAWMKQTIGYLWGAGRRRSYWS